MHMMQEYVHEKETIEFETLHRYDSPKNEPFYLDFGDPIIPRSNQIIKNETESNRKRVNHVSRWI